VTSLRAALLAIVTAFALLPAGAEAKPGYKVRPAGTELWIDLGEKGDYEVLLEANDRQRVLLAVEEGLFTATEYSTEGHVSSKRIEADLGELGRIDIDVRLRPGRSASYPPPKNCKGPASIEVPGSFRGTIKFTGEGGIPPFTVKHGEISFTRRFKRVCKPRQRAPEKGKEKRAPKLDVGILEAFGEVEGRTSFFGAINYALRRNPARAFGLLIAGAFEKREDVLVESSTLSFFGPGSLQASKPGRKPETVKVMKLLEPFAGRALYRRKPGSPPSWTGNLNVDLPGAKKIPLADFESGLKVRFCRGPSEAVAEERCAYGSGSHSQPLALAKLSSLR
jgi:hypothetical protein